MRPAGCLAAIALAVTLATVWGCAPYPAAPAPGGSTPAPAPRTSGSAAPRGAGGEGTATTFAPVDTTPSREALEVLATIPEPVPEAERVPSPEAPPAGATTAAPPVVTPGSTGQDSTTPATPVTDSAATASPSDTTSTASSAAPDSGETAVPVPSPTYALGLAPPPPPDTSAADSSATQAAGASGGSRAPRPSGPPPGLLAGSPPDTCWRVQIGAPKLRAQGESLRAASESLLLVPMVVEHEAGLYKVRVRDCMARAAADAMKRRAVQTGFMTAVRFAGRRP